jgi:hypothetical protein
MMKRLARLLPLRQFGRLHHLRMLRGCNVAGLAALGRPLARALALDRHTAPQVQASLGLWPELPPDPYVELPQASRPAYARIGLRAPQPAVGGMPQPAPLAYAPAAAHTDAGATAAAAVAAVSDAAASNADPVRVYRGPSRVTLVGHIDAVCRMIDRCIAEENAGLGRGLFEQPA